MTTLRPCGPATSDSTMLSHNVYSSFAQMDHLKRAWNDLACRAGDLFCSYDWCETWWRHFGRGRQLEVHTLHKEHRLVGVLPLFRETLLAGWICLHVVRLLACDYASDAAGLAVEMESADTLLRTVLASLTGRDAWDVLHLGPLRSYNSVTEQISTMCASSPLVGTVILGQRDNWLTLYELSPTYDAYLQSLPRHDRHDTLRRQRRLRERHHVEVCRACTPDEVRYGMDAVIRLHQALWTEKGQSGHFGAWPSLAEFHHETAQRFAMTGQLALLTLKVDGEVVGASYGYHFGARTHGIVRGYRNDGPWRSFSLGRLLHCEFVRTAIEQGSTILESGRGVFDYKLRLGGQLHGEQSITVIARGWRARLRFWTALRIAYVVHVLYGRLWLDMLAPRLGIRPVVRHFYVRYGFLAQLFRRTRFSLFAGGRLRETECISSLPPEEVHGS